MSLGLWLEAVRLPFLTGSLTPVLAAWAWSGAGRWPEFMLTMLGTACLHLGSNLINDYYDARGSDPLNEKTTPFSGGSRVIQNGRLEARTVLNLGLGFFAAALVCGLALTALGRPWVLALGALGLGIGFFYSASNLAFMRRGLGEIAVFMSFGPLVTWGAGYVFAGHFSLAGFMLGTPQAWLISAVLWINQFPDYEADRAAGKNNLVVRLGTARSRAWYAALMLLPYPSLALLVHGFGMTPWLYLAFASLPVSLRACKIAREKHDEFKALIPAQAQTILAHLLTGLLMTVGFLI